MSLATATPAEVKDLLSRVPDLVELQRAVAADRIAHRASLIRHIDTVNEAFAARDAATVAELEPISTQLRTLREKVEDLERKEQVLTLTRQSALFVRDGAVSTLESELRKEAAASLRDFNRTIDATRNEIQHNITSRRDAVLQRFRLDLTKHQRDGRGDAAHARGLARGKSASRRSARRGCPTESVARRSARRPAWS